MENIQWIFDGIGTTIISLAIGGAAGYIIWISKNKQSQVSGKNSKQIQKNDTNSSVAINNQSQKSGANSVQYQENRNGNK